MGLMLVQIKNPNTLNIFTDASITKRPYGYDGCYSALAVVEESLLDNIIRVSSDSTNNNSEIKGILAGVNLAIKYQHIFPVINIFSDSQLSIFGIRDRLVKWDWDIINQKLYTKSDTPVQSQDIYLELAYLILQYNLNVNFFHQKGHVTNKNNDLVKAKYVFEVSNGFTRVDINIIRYISRWNDIADNISRETLLKTSKNLSFKDAITFYPQYIDFEQYEQLMKNDFKK